MDPQEGLVKGFFVGPRHHSEAKYESQSGERVLVPCFFFKFCQILLSLIRVTVFGGRVLWAFRIRGCGDGFKEE